MAGKNRASPSFEDSKEDTLCGIGSWHPAFLQRFANVKIFAVNFGVINLAYICFFTYFVGVLTTMEKRFEFPSRDSGILMACNDITHLIFIVLVSYFAGNKRRPFFIAVAGICFSLGILFFALPHFIFGPRSDNLNFDDVNVRQTEVVDVTSTMDFCKISTGNDSITPVGDCAASEGNKVAYAILIIAELFIGIGTSTMYPLGFSYIDDNVKGKVSPLYMGFILSARTCGPIFGFLLAAGTTSLYVDLSDPPLSRTDPRWIGAWWLGYVIVFVVMFCGCVPLLLYPKKMPKLKNRVESTEMENKEQLERERKLKEEHEEQHRAFDMLINKPKEMLKGLWSLITNVVYMCVVFGSCASLYTIAGLKLFMPKYLEAQFGVTTSQASVYTGVVGVASATIGLAGGGWLMKRYKVGTRGALMITILGSFALLAGVLINMFLGCAELPLAARFEPHRANMVTFNQTCNANCGCVESKFSPVCGNDGLNYFSPCFAGCMSKNMTAGCGCVGSEDTAFVDAVTQGYCERDCTTRLLAYLITFFITGLLASPAAIAIVMVKLRCVKKEEKALSLGLGSFLQSILTWLPGPIIAGALIDKACILWQENDCQETGSCWMYDLEKFRFTIHGFAGSFKALSILLFVIAWYKCPADTNEEDNEKNAS